jgi:prepilin-type N-terminal cleavage/methylation domain-containing protein
MAFRKKSSSAFTIVELLIVIVVVGILAAITIVAYSGISSRAVVSSLQSDLEGAAKLLKLDQVTNSSFPTSLPLANGGNGVPSSSGTVYTYAASNTSPFQTFCITATKNNIDYNITQDGSSQPGICPILNLDAGNTSSYPGTGTTWTDLSGNGNNGTLNGGVSYSSANGGAMTYNGTSGYVSAGNSASLKLTGDITMDTWIYLNHNLYPPGVTNWEVISSEIYQSSGFLFRIDGASGKPLVRTNQAGSSSEVQSTIGLAVRTWYNIVISKSGNTARIYINGTLNTSGTSSSPVAAVAPLTVGGNGQRFDGLIGSARIYNAPLSADTILQNFNALRGRYGL